MSKKIRGYKIRPEELVSSWALANFFAILRKLLGGERISGLYQAISDALKSLQLEHVKLLDFGCGAMGLSARLKETDHIVEFIGMDVFAPPEYEKLDAEIWKNYRQIPSQGPLIEDRFDVAIIADALHHADEGDHVFILRRVSEVADWIIVKDHFEYSWFSRQVLRMADFYGNYAFGVNVPNRYFTPQRWSRLVHDAGLQEERLQVGIAIHKGFFSFILPAKLHFISMLRKRT